MFSLSSSATTSRAFTYQFRYSFWILELYVSPNAVLFAMEAQSALHDLVLSVTMASFRLIRVQEHPGHVQKSPESQTVVLLIETIQ